VTGKAADRYPAGAKYHDSRESAIALEVMSRFAVDSVADFIHLPTMSPTETTKQPGLLEHPEELAYFRHERRVLVVCEQNRMGSRGLWDELKTDWICLDCEAMLWSTRAHGLLRVQYAPVGLAGSLSVQAAQAAIEAAIASIPDLTKLLKRIQKRKQAMRHSTYRTYRQYCRPVHTLASAFIAKGKRGISQPAIKCRGVNTSGSSTGRNTRLGGT
jgi:protein phosphatase